MDSNSEIQGYNVYPMLHFRRKFSSGITAVCLCNVKNVQSRSGVTQSGAELLWSGRELTTKVGKQPWPQLVHCASICCCMCGCVFQEDGIVVRSAGEE